jgi:hypothetical protein
MLTVTNSVIAANNTANAQASPAGNQLIAMAKSRSLNGRRLLAGTSYGGGRVPDPSVVTESDFLLLHGNSVEEPERIREMVRQTRRVSGYTSKPILFNEDDHFNFDQPDNNFLAALDEYASWGLFDYRFEGEDADNGYQSVPANWGISSDRKREFFELAKRVAEGDR